MSKQELFPALRGLFRTKMSSCARRDECPKWTFDERTERSRARLVRMLLLTDRLANVARPSP
jgi:hypothetical protein